MMDFCRPPIDCLEYNGHRYKIQLPYDRVLLIYEVWADDVLTDTDKIDQTIRILFPRGRQSRFLALESAETRTGLVTLIFEQCINTRMHRAKKAPRAFDFKQDADYIYASFMFDYNIDLLEQRGRLDWRKFIALFQGLSKDAKISEVISIRTRDYPKADEYNREEISALRELKEYYALEKTFDEKETGIQEGLADLFGILKSWAEAK